MNKPKPEIKKEKTSGKEVEKPRGKKKPHGRY